MTEYSDRIGSENDNKKNTTQDQKLDVWVLLDQTRYTIFRARELELSQSGITPEQAAVLRILENNPKGVAPAEMPKMLIREPHSIYGLLGRMQKRGLIKRVKGSVDGKIRVVLTSKGKQLYTKSLDRTSLHMILSVLSEEELERLAGILAKLKERASNLLGIDYKPPFLK